MAQSLETLRSALLTSIFGRRLGLTSDEYVAGAKAMKGIVQDLTSASTGTALNAYGTVNIAGTSLLTSAQSFLFSNPVPGVDVTINNIRSNATAGASGCTALTIQRATTAFYILSSDTSSGVEVHLNQGCSITLRGITTALYQVIGLTGAGSTVGVTS